MGMAGIQTGIYHLEKGFDRLLSPHSFPTSLSRIQLVKPHPSIMMVAHVIVVLPQGSTLNQTDHVQHLSCYLYPYIFLIDIKLALGNNPYHFFALLLECSCRLHLHPPSVFCWSAVPRTSRVSSNTHSKMAT